MRRITDAQGKLAYRSDAWCAEVEAVCAEFGVPELAERALKEGASAAQIRKALEARYPDRVKPAALPSLPPQPNAAVMQEREWAAEIIGLCKIAGMPGLAVGLLRQRADIARVREYLVDHRAALSDAPGEIDCTPPAPTDSRQSAAASWEGAIARINAEVGRDAAGKPITRPA
jgi:hypothetical protein